MTRLLPARRTPAQPLSERTRRTSEPRHRAPGPGRHRAERPRTPRGRIRYAALGLLALSGAVAAPAMSPDPTAALAPAPEPVALRPLAVKPAAQVVQNRRPPRRAKRPARTRWVTRTVAGPVLHGRATWYGPGFAGRRTASGEVFRPATALTAAHRTLPFGTRLRVCRGERCVVVRINDRGPFGNAILDLSWLAARRIGLDSPGIAPVTATILYTKRVRVRS